MSFEPGVDILVGRGRFVSLIVVSPGFWKFGGNLDFALLSFLDHLNCVQFASALMLGCLHGLAFD